MKKFCEILSLMPFVNYSEMVHHFIDDVYDFNENNKDFGLNHYYDILEKMGLNGVLNS